MIRKIAWSFHHTTRIEYDELFSEACFYYVKALKKYDHKSKFKFTTFAYRVMNNGLKNFVNKYQNFVHPDTNDVFDRVVQFNSYMELFYGEKAKKISDMIIENANFFSSLPDHRVIRSIISKLSHKGWSHGDIKEGIEEIQNTLAHGHY
jgi:DNA-directed RNA polymerase specialized sigma24 family protein